MNRAANVVLALIAGAAAGVLVSGTIAMGSRNASGTYSLPAGNPVVSGSTISSTTHNNTMADVATEITNSLDRGGRGAMTAALQLYDGTQAAPGLTFGSDADTGLYRVGANNPAMSAGNTKVQDWKTTGVTLPLGLVCTQSQSNTTGITSTGNGTAAGVAGTGGATDALGVVGTGGATNGSGVEGFGTGTGIGVIGQGGAGAGAIGVEGVGGASNGVGVKGIGQGTGAAVEVGAGNLLITASDPSSSTAYKNRLTTGNIVKAWATVQLNGTATPAIDGGFSVTGASASSTLTTVTFAQAFANTNFAVVATVQYGSGGSFTATVQSKTTTTVVIDTFSAGVEINPSTTSAVRLNIMAIGLQ